ncbi:MAG: hypothetical protein WCF45_10605 [Photobacterium halotolerans]
MPSFSIGQFRGALPRVAPHLLPEQAAQVAENCKFERGYLEPISDLSPVGAAIKAGTKSLFNYLGQHWFSWTTEVTAVSSPIPKDPYQRVYFCGTDVPRFTKQDIAIGGTLPEASIKLGVPKPAGKISANAPSGGSGDITDAADDETRFYIFTWVTDLGEEGPPSDPSNVVTVYNPESDSVSLSLPAIGTNDRNITHRRVYRSATAGDVAEWLLVTELPVNTTSYTDNKKAVSLGAALATENHFPPPAAMKGLTALANGVLVGFDGNIICPSEPNLPYAYNPNNQLSCEFDIVAIGALPSGAVIATTGQPYLLQGYTPDSYQLIKLETSAPCVSARSLVDMGSVVVYASGEGLIAIGAGEPELVTRDIFTKEQWQALKPETIHAYQYGSKYVAFSDVCGFVINQETMDVTYLSFNATAGLRIPATEDLALVVGDELFLFDDDAARLPMKWRSRLYRTMPVSLSSVKAFGENVELLFHRDGQVIHAHQLTGPVDIFRLPAGYGREWEIEVKGTGTLESVAIATSMSELP